ncbi:hypothetical protein PAI11_19090 [Patulibacter medicamentivorans]|uniref:Uncharacterized protein n=1 Tax=Patulibacter medicamentivorans TaxID=1097667 RepID=H0E524_9ACTN|nr:hypothetical protein PAI11_19090 [Patulibacter medicamentivorans]
MAVGVLLPDAPTVLLTLAPALVAFALLASGRYVGEERLARAARAFRARRRRPARRLAAVGAAPRAVPPRGGRLIAASLAVRPPPGAPLAA